MSDELPVVRTTFSLMSPPQENKSNGASRDSTPPPNDLFSITTNTDNCTATTTTTTTTATTTGFLSPIRTTIPNNHVDFHLDIPPIILQTMTDPSVELHQRVISFLVVYPYKMKTIILLVVLRGRLLKGLLLVVILYDGHMAQHVLSMTKGTADDSRKV